MLSNDQIAGPIESQEVIFSEAAVNEALQIEKILNRAYEIRRARGGLFGYDLEDWLQAERELAERKRASEFQTEERTRAESLPRDQERNCVLCIGFNN
jgi:hypothetical protein